MDKEISVPGSRHAPVSHWDTEDMHRTLRVAQYALRHVTKM